MCREGSIILSLICLLAARNREMDFQQDVEHVVDTTKSKPYHGTLYRQVELL
jgi:hypothetical protein